jgi:hypothetical protein
LSATCLGCGSSRCSYQKCAVFCKPCDTCQTAPTKVVPEPLPECKKRKNMIMQPSLNLHACTQLGDTLWRTLLGLKKSQEWIRNSRKRRNNY